MLEIYESRVEQYNQRVHCSINTEVLCFGIIVVSGLVLFIT